MNVNEQGKIRLGACAWSFEEWRGSFYPEELPTSEWLECYARSFNAVEIDSTFYSAPADEVMQRWVELSPPNFRFACKLPRQITHECRLHDCSAELKSFCGSIELLAPKLGVILIQLPPSFSPGDGRTALRNFLPQLPRDFRFAIEFRHSGWHRPQIIRLLEKFGVSWVWADTSPLNERNLAPFEFLPLTADFLYVRLLGDYTTKYDGDGQHVHRYGKLLWKREAALDSWALKIQRHLADMRNVWIFANNHFEGFAPETAQRLAHRLDLEVSLPNESKDELVSANAAQMTLFPAA